MDQHPEFISYTNYEHTRDVLLQMIIEPQDNTTFWRIAEAAQQLSNAAWLLTGYLEAKEWGFVMDTTKLPVNANVAYKSVE